MSAEQAQGQSKYGDRLRQSDQQRAEADVQFAVEEAQQSLAADKLETKKHIAKLQRDINQLKNATKLDANAIIAKQAELEGYQEGLKRLEALEAELF
jgi:hypothetical protein